MVDKPYWQKLKDPRWQKKRLEILERDKWSCQFCDRGELDEVELHVHHKGYKWGNEPWDYPNWNFIALCADCHKTETEDIKSSQQDLLWEFRRLGVDSQALHDLNITLRRLPDGVMQGVFGLHSSMFGELLRFIITLAEKEDSDVS